MHRTSLIIKGSDPLRQYLASLGPDTVSSRHVWRSQLPSPGPSMAAIDSKKRLVPASYGSTL